MLSNGVPLESIEFIGVGFGLLRLHSAQASHPPRLGDFLIF
jgi:hypothetical protein